MADRVLLDRAERIGLCRILAEELASLEFCQSLAFESCLELLSDASGGFTGHIGLT